MNLLAKLSSSQAEVKIAVIGLGYVGLPLAVEFGKKYSVIGFDLSSGKIDAYNQLIDPTGEVSREELQLAVRPGGLEPTTDARRLAAADFLIIAVPTPVDTAHTPDFGPLIGASAVAGQHMKKGATIVYESTVYVSFMVAAILASPFLPRADVIVGTSPQFFTPCAALVVSWMRWRPFVFELRDLWPDSIVAVGAMRETAVIRALRKLEYFLYRRAARIVSVTQSFKRVLAGNGIPAAKIAVVPNGVDLEAYQPGPRPVDLARRLGVEGKFVAAYVGTVGMAHGIGTLLDAARALRHRDDIAFVVVGTGAQQAELAATARSEGLSNVIFVGAVSKAEVRDYWRLCDAAVVLLRDTPLFRHVIPSKMFEAMGMERAIILGVKGESEQILLDSEAGVTIPPEDADALAQAVVSMANDAERCAMLGKRGRRYASKMFNREILANRMLEELKGCR